MYNEHIYLAEKRQNEKHILQYARKVHKIQGTKQTDRTKLFSCKNSIKFYHNSGA